MTQPRLLRLALLLPASLLTACASGMSGLDSRTAYACRAPTGAQCTSVSGVYANTTASSPAPSSAAQSVRPPPVVGGADAPRPTPDIVPSDSVPTGAPVFTPAIGANTAAIRVPPRILRLWVAPWEDADGDLHEASHVHVIVNAGRWQIDRLRPLQARTAQPPAID